MTAERHLDCSSRCVALGVGGVLAAEAKTSTLVVLELEGEEGAKHCAPLPGGGGRQKRVK